MLSATITKAFTASFSWAGIPACAKTSPEFHLFHVPAATKQLRFAMTDLNVPSFHHGGSVVAYDGDTIRKGAIHYIGPCPPGGQRHRYLWTVQALDGTGTVLATTMTIAVFPS